MGKDRRGRDWEKRRELVTYGQLGHSLKQSAHLTLHKPPEKKKKKK